MMAVFISYSHTDKDVADNITALLDELDVPYFRDVKDIEWGDAITSKVRDGLKCAAAVIVIISPGSLKSHWVSYEVGFASAQGTRLLPFLTHPSLDPPGFISDLSYAKNLDEVREYFTDWEPPETGSTPETGGSAKSQFGRLIEMMPELLTEMKEDVSNPANKFVREFVPLTKKGIVFNYSKAHLQYYGDTHEHLQNKIDMIEDADFARVVHEGKYSKIYRMTEEFVSLLLEWNNAT